MKPVLVLASLYFWDECLVWDAEFQLGKVDEISRTRSLSLQTTVVSEVRTPRVTALPPDLSVQRRAAHSPLNLNLQYTDGHTYSQRRMPVADCHFASMQTNQRPNIRWAYGRNERASHQQ